MGALVMSLSACGGGSGTSGQFSIKVTGSTEVSWTHKNGQASLGHENVVELPTHTLHFSDAQRQLAAVVIFYGANMPPAGTYPLSSTVRPQAGHVTGLLVDNRASIHSFTAQSGTLDLRQDGQAYSGTFTFEAAGGGIGSRDQRVTVRGEFKNVR